MIEPTKINDSKAQDLHIIKNWKSIFDKSQSKIHFWQDGSKDSKLFSNLKTHHIQRPVYLWNSLLTSKQQFFLASVLFDFARIEKLVKQNWYKQCSLVSRLFYRYTGPQTLIFNGIYRTSTLTTHMNCRGSEKRNWLHASRAWKKEEGQGESPGVFFPWPRPLWP